MTTILKKISPFFHNNQFCELYNPQIEKIHLPEWTLTQYINFKRFLRRKKEENLLSFICSVYYYWSCYGNKSQSEKKKIIFHIMSSYFLPLSRHRLPNQLRDYVLEKVKQDPFDPSIFTDTCVQVTNILKQYINR
eukprot:TRINITY_DN9784_c0_g1_i2.p1 TRINITY_DN9784_c0_g1~~TRINITY_DN9784_c0_g1_i2.p1  ORF type:complete len:152 (-),score=12.74 TRINITY_DN9784_c0_g1_i2:225-629(-)